jgi:hypothetical protein
MDKKPFEQRSGQGPGVQHEPVKPEPGRRIPQEPEKNRTPRRPTEPSDARRVDKPAPGSAADLEGEDVLEGERTDQRSGRPVKLDEHDKTRPGVGGRPQESGKTREGQPIPS